MAKAGVPLHTRLAAAVSLASSIVEYVARAQSRKKASKGLLVPPIRAQRAAALQASRQPRAGAMRPAGSSHCGCGNI